MRGSRHAPPTAPARERSTQRITIDKYFDRIFILNMERRLDRWFNMVHRMERLGIENYERFLATDGYTEPYKGQWEAYSKTPYNSFDKKYNRKAIRSPGVWGILNSMKRMILVAKKRGLKRILVLQDDAMFHHDFTALFDQKIRRVPADWKMLYLGVTQYDYARDMLNARDWYHPMGMADGAFAVAFDSSIYDYLIKQINRFVMPFDSGPLMAVQRQFARQTYVIRPFLIIADTSESDCRSDRRTEEFAKKVKWDYPRFIEHQSIPAQPLVSVLMVTDNSAHYVADAIYSVLNQNYRNIELIVLDNASTDQTVAEVEQFKKVRLYRSPSRTTLATLWNIGLLMSRGELITLHQPTYKSLQVRLEAQVKAVGLGAQYVTEPHQGNLFTRLIFAEVGYLDLSPLIDPFYEFYAKIERLCQAEPKKFPVTRVTTPLYLPYAQLANGTHSPDNAPAGQRDIDQFHSALIKSGKSLYRPFPPKERGYSDLELVGSIITEYR